MVTVTKLHLGTSIKTVCGEGEGIDIKRGFTTKKVNKKIKNSDSEQDSGSDFTSPY